MDRAELEKIVWSVPVLLFSRAFMSRMRSFFPQEKCFGDRLDLRLSRNEREGFQAFSSAGNET